MVSRKTNRRKAVKIRRIGFLGVVLGLILSLAAFVVCVIDFVGRDEPQNIETTEVVESPGENILDEVQKIDFQSVVDGFVARTGGEKSVLIYDLEREEVAGSYNTAKNYNTASLYKLFVVYEGYRRVESGDWNADEMVSRSGKTILECLDLAVRESNSVCAEILWGMIGQEELDRIVREDYGILNSDISGLSSNAGDVAEIMKRFYYHPEIKNEALISRMKDSFLNQPVTNGNWQQGLPSGFSDAVKVYNKVGWLSLDGRSWNLYHDAAIVEFPEQNRHFIVVVMTERISPNEIKEFGSEIERYFYAQS